VVGGKADSKPEGGVDERYYTDLFNLNLVTGEERRLTDTQNIGEWSPTSSPDGKKLAFSGTEYDPATWKIVSYGIYTMDPDGTNQIEGVKSQTPIRSFQWSPDSREIAYCTDDGKTGIDSSEIHAVDVKTGADRNLTNTPTTGELDPAWSPDGKKIAFYSGTFREGYRLRVMDPEGKNAVDLTEPGEYPRGAVSWSPDGRTILFTDRSAIYSIGADGKDRKVLLDGKGAYRDLMYPVWLFEQGTR
jgi:Tol biopolymer transport system component